MNKIVIIKTILLTSILLLSGCIVAPIDPESGHYYLNPYSDFSNVGRATVLEFDDYSETGSHISESITQAVTESLRKKHLFNVNTLYRSDPIWLKLNLKESSLYTLEELSAIRKELRTNAVIIGSVTQHYPYPHMLIGLNIRMIDLRNGKLLWAMEQVWDSTDKRVEKRMKVFYHTHMRTGYDPINWQIVMTSPRAFNKFVSSEVSETFPERRFYRERVLSSENNKNFRKNPTILDKTLEIPEKTLKFVEELTTIEM